MSILSTYPPKGGVGKREAHINWSMVGPAKSAPVTKTTLRTTSPVAVDSQQLTHCVPAKLGTDPMRFGRLNK